MTQGVVVEIFSDWGNAGGRDEKLIPLPLSVDDVKQELAETLLANQDLTITDIAYKLGYFEPTSFQRAFRQWTGCTPMEYRKNKP